MNPNSRFAAMLAAAALTAGTTLTAPLAHAEPDDTGSLMLVLDASGSMRDPDGSGTTRIASAQRALTSVVEKLPAEASVGMRVFGAEVDGDPMPAAACQDTQRVVGIGTDNRAELLSAISAYEPSGWTPIPEALRQAAADLGPEGKRHIILVSDGESTCDPDPCEVAAEIAAKGIGLTIDVVGLNVDASTRTQLTCIAENGGGEYVDANSADELIAALDQSTQRAVRPFEFDGTPINGSTYEGDAPRITAGVWRDTLGPGASGNETHFYRVERTMKNSSLQAAALGFLSRSHHDALTVEIVNRDGRSCGTAGSSVNVTKSLVIGAVGTFTDDDSKHCADERELWIKVSRNNSKAPADLPVQLWVRELPQVDPTYSSTEPIVTFVGEKVPATSPTPVEPGSSVANATLLTPGKTITASILPNEVQVFRVPTGWGQAARATIERRERRDGGSGGFLRIKAVHPSGESEAQANGLFARWAGKANAETRPMWSASPRGANPAGDALFFVYWSTEENSTHEAVDYLMTAEVAGDLVEAPDYLTTPIDQAEDPTGSPSPEASPTNTPSPTPTMEPTPTATEPTDPATAESTEATTEAEGDATGSVVLPMAIGGAVLLVGGGAAAWLLSRRR